MYFKIIHNYKYFINYDIIINTLKLCISILHLFIDKLFSYYYYYYYVFILYLLYFYNNILFIKFTKK